uniref:Tail assembly chaperone n=1 Tax=Streptomyces phage Kamino TaxID=3158857 RepID=A0AAU7GXE4_9CAUD
MRASYREPVSDPLQVLHDVLGAEVIPVPEQLALPLAGIAEPPGLDEVSEALRELHSVAVLQEIPEPPGDDEA